MFKFVQVNLDRSRLATHELRIHCEKENVDVACIQEPYINKGEIPGMPTDAVTLITEDPGSMVAVVIFNKKIEALVDSKYTCKWIQTFTLKLGKHQITIVNLYCQFSMPADIFVNKLETILEGFYRGNLLILGDFNAKSPLWHCPGTDGNGEKYEDIINQYQLVVHNKEDQPPTFQGRAGAESNIDITMTKGNIHRNIHEWSVLEHATTSQHGVISFYINFTQDKNNSNEQEESNKLNYSTKKLNYTKLMNKLELPQIERDVDLDDIAKKIEKVTQKAIVSVAPKTNKTNNRKPFWTQKLDKLKRRLKASRKSYKAARDHELKIQRLNKYRQIKQEFEIELFENKKKTWGKFVDENLCKDIWGMPYKIVMQKIKTKGVMNTLKKDDGTFTMNWQQTMELIFTKLFPDDSEDNDNEEHSRMRQEVRQPPEAGEEQELPTITNEEIKAALKSLKANKAPGPDGIKNEIYKSLAEFWAPYLAKLYNECLRQGRYPEIWKKANLIILYKGQDKPKTNPKSYRPICLLNVISKIFEKVLINRINDKRENLEHCNLQYGFRRGKSTEDAINEFCEAVNRLKQDNCKYVMGVFFDIAGAFDNV